MDNLLWLCKERIPNAWEILTHTYIHIWICLFPSLKMKVMTSKVEADIQAFGQEMDKFASRWHQLKPRDDIAMEGDQEATAAAVASLRERRAEFDEFMSTAKKLR